MSRSFPGGLYAIADTDCTGSIDLLNAAHRAILGGAQAIQYRDRGGDVGRRIREAAGLRDLCRDHSVPFIIDDDIRLAAEIVADGIHLGRHSVSVEDARRKLGPLRFVGVLCHTSLARARRSEQDGADYVMFGDFFPSQDRDSSSQASLSLLTEARAALSIPVVATGGLTPQNSPALITAGAASLAVSRGVFDHRDPESAAHHFAVLFD